MLFWLLTARGKFCEMELLNKLILEDVVFHLVNFYIFRCSNISWDFVCHLNTCAMMFQESFVLNVTIMKISKPSK